jgi:hypothetical protein
LTASAGNNQITLSWTGVTGATGYDVYRGTQSGSETLLSAGTNVAVTSFTDGSAINGTQYFYYVTALNGSVQSGKSNEVSATPRAPAPASLVLAISAGGPAAGWFVADTDYRGGRVSPGTKATIKTTGLTNPPPQSVFQHGRTGNFTYTIPALTPGARYLVRLDFVEYNYKAPRSRVFNVAINGAQVLRNFHISSAAGGEYIAVARSFTATASTAGRITVAFRAVVRAPIVSGIEIYTATSARTARHGSAGNTRTHLTTRSSLPRHHVDGSAIRKHSRGRPVVAHEK